MAEGWIKLHRKIRDNPLFKEKRKFSKFEAWIDLLLAANHADNEVVFGYEKIPVKRGQLITSEVQLSDRWKWNRLSVRRFLTYLTREQMLSKSATSKYTVLTIVNYDLYQGEYTAEDTSNEHQRYIKDTSKIHQSNTNKNVKKNKNDKNEKKKDIIGEFSPEFSKALNDFKEMRQRIRKPMTDRAVELLLKNLNKITLDESEMIEILEQSIANSWQGVFPLKQQKHQKSKTDQAIELAKKLKAEEEGED